MVRTIRRTVQQHDRRYRALLNQQNQRDNRASRKPSAGRFAGEEVQKYVRVMENWRRQAWAQAGYPTKKSDLENISGESGRRHVGAPSRLRPRS